MVYKYVERASIEHIIGQIQKMLSLRDCPHDKEQRISASTLTEASFLSVTGIQQISWLPKQRYSRPELMSLKQLDLLKCRNFASQRGMSINALTHSNIA